MKSLKAKFDWIPSYLMVGLTESTALSVICYEISARFNLLLEMEAKPIENVQGAIIVRLHL